MKNTKCILFLSFLLAALTLAPGAMAQTIEDQRTETETETGKDARSIDTVAAARSKYTQTSDISLDAGNTTLAQLRGRGPGHPFPSQRPYPRGTYQTPWRYHGDAGHILVGAAIGFGIGAALGAHNSARDGTPVAGGIVIGGGLFDLLGGCVGKAVGDLQDLHFASAHHRGTHLPSGPNNNDDESELASHPNPHETHTGQSARPTTPSPPAALRRVEP